MRRLSELGVVVGLLLWASTAQAGEWRGYLSLGAGIALDRYSEWDAKGAAVNVYFGVEAPIGLSVGIYGEGAETWGQKFEDLQQNASSRVQLDYKQYGLEVRFRGFRTRMISPWVSLRLAHSRSTPQTPNEFGALVRQEFQDLGAALRFGLDWWLGAHWGLTGATSWGWCDVRYEKEAVQKCAKPLNTLLVGPTIRF